MAALSVVTLTDSCQVQAPLMTRVEASARLWSSLCMVMRYDTYNVMIKPMIQQLARLCGRRHKAPGFKERVASPPKSGKTEAERRK